MKLLRALESLEHSPGDESTLVPWEPSADLRSSANNSSDDAEQSGPGLDELLAMSGSGAPLRTIRVSRVCLPTFDRRSMSLGRTESFDLYDKMSNGSLLLTSSMSADLAVVNDKEAEETDAAAASAPALCYPSPDYEMSATVVAPPLRYLSPEYDEDDAVESEPAPRCPSFGDDDETDAAAASEPAPRCPKPAAKTGRKTAGHACNYTLVQIKRVSRPRTPAPIANIGIKVPLVNTFLGGVRNKATTTGRTGSRGFGGPLVNHPKTQRQPLAVSPAKAPRRTRGKVHPCGESARESHWAPR